MLSGRGSGSTSGVISGVDWAARDASSKNCRTCVASMSLGGPYSRTLNRAVDASVKSGLHFVTASGNEHQDACDVSPASAEGSITVSSTNSRDEMSYFSNYGQCVDIFAPGEQITSAWIGSKDAKNTISGTSMSTPHVTAVILSILSRGDNYRMTSADIRDYLTSVATKDVVTGIPMMGDDTPNLLLFNDVKQSQ